MSEAAIDQEKVEAFVQRATGDASGLMTMLFCYIGDRLGLFGELRGGGPSTPHELADATGLDERYVAEWLRGLSAAGYLESDRESGRYALPDEHAVVLAEEESPVFLGGACQQMFGMMEPLDEILKAFEDGRGVDLEEYGEDLWEGMERSTNAMFDNFLVQDWIPAMPSVEDALESGCRFADIGCGAGRALIRLAEAYPDSRFTGYDLSPTQVQRARDNIEAEGLTERIDVEVGEVEEGLPGEFDVVSAFDVVHDAVDPRRFAEEVRESLTTGGSFVCLETNCADEHMANDGPVAATFYGYSVLYCLSTSLANDGAGLGTCGLPEATFRELCAEAGFSDVRVLPWEHPFNKLYQARA